MSEAWSGTGDRTAENEVRDAEAALKRLGYARVSPALPEAPGGPELWVQESGIPRRTFPVFVEAGKLPATKRWDQYLEASAPGRAIAVVESDTAAEAAWRQSRADPRGGLERELAILVVSRRPGGPTAHWHAGVVDRRDLLRLSTGIVVGLFRRAASSPGSGEVDFEELLVILKRRFGIDVNRTLGVRSDADALFIMYQLALKEAYAPGDPSANLHTVIFRPNGPGSRLPWFAG